MGGARITIRYHILLRISRFLRPLAGAAVTAIDGSGSDGVVVCGFDGVKALAVTGYRKFTLEETSVTL